MINPETNLAILGIKSASELCADDTSYRALQKAGRKLFQGLLEIIDAYFLVIYIYDEKTGSFQEEAIITPDADLMGHDLIPRYQLPEELTVLGKIVQSYTGSRFETFIPLTNLNQLIGLLLIFTNTAIPDKILNDLEFLNQGLALGIKYVINSRQAERISRILKAATHTSRQLQKINDPENFFAGFINLIVTELGFERATLFFFGEDGKTVTRALCACIGHPVMELKRIPVIPELQDFSIPLDDFPGVWLPVNIGTRHLGALLVDNLYSLETVPDDMAETLFDLCGQVALMLENAQLFARLSEIARHDDLTGLFRSGYFYEVLQEHLSMLKQCQGSSGLLIMDIDHFKQINDTCGHMAGDVILTNAAALLREILRPKDMACRMGGDEFIVLFADCDESRIIDLAGEVLRQFRGHQFRLADGRKIYITVSIGVTILSSDTIHWQHAISRADQALYHSKAHGRNQFSFFK